MINFEDLIQETAAGWQWQLPDKFNITYACVRQHVERGVGDKLAMIVDDEDKGSSRITYGELDDLSGRLASVLKQLGLGREDRALIRLPNAIEYPVSFFGCLRQGLIAVPTSTLLSEPEVAYLTTDSGAKILITAKSMWDELRSIITQDTKLHTVLLTGDEAMPEVIASSAVQVLDYEQLMQDAHPDLSIADTVPDDPAYLVYTSGTTGYPKGVLHAHRSLIGRLPASRHWFDFEPGDRILHSGKFNWTYALGTALMDPLFHGHTVVVHEGPSDASTWPRLIAQHRCTIFIGVPTIYRQIIQKTEFSSKDVLSLRHCMSAGEHLSDEMLLAWRQRFQMDIYEALGMSEFSYYISQNKLKPIRPGSAGFIQPGHEAVLLDEEQHVVENGVEGMLAIKETDPGLFLNYWHLPEETKKSRHNGFFFTGDYAKADSDGYIWFIGRRDDIINSFGYRVSPHEIERVLKTHPDVADCVALGEQIDKDKTLISACVVLLPESNSTEQDILAFGAERLAKYKAPKMVHFYQQFPRTKNGKILRKEMKKQLEKAGWMAIRNSP